MIIIALPPPPSANRYWKTAMRNGHAVTYVSTEAKNYKHMVASYCRVAGIRAPITGRVAITVALYPHRPQDWVKRASRDPTNWDDGVRCIDLDNANKVLLDALKGVAIVDDGWQVRSLHSDRMEPDGQARVIVTITPIHTQPAQLTLMPAPSLLDLARPSHDGVPF